MIRPSFLHSQAALAGAANVTAPAATRRRLLASPGPGSPSSAAPLTQLPAQVGQAVLDGLLSAAASGFARSSAARGLDVLVSPSKGSASLYALGFSGTTLPSLPAAMVPLFPGSFRALTAALLRGATPGSRPVALTSGTGAISWPPPAAGAPASSVLCSPAYALTVARHAAPPGGGAGSSVSVLSPLPPCGYRVGAPVPLAAPPAAVAFPRDAWDGASASAGASGGPVSLDTTVLQWAVGPTPGSAGWNASSESVGAGINVTALNTAAAAAAAASPNAGAPLVVDRRLSSPMGAPQQLRGSLAGALDEASLGSAGENKRPNAAPFWLPRRLEASPPQPCSGSLGASVRNGALFPRLAPAAPQHGLDSPVVSVTLALSDGTPVSSWASRPGALVNISIPYSAAAALQADGSADPDAPLAGLAALKVCFECRYGAVCDMHTGRLPTHPRRPSTRPQSSA